jgi:hypothetical protein
MRFCRGEIHACDDTQSAVPTIVRRFAGSRRRQKAITGNLGQRRLFGRCRPNRSPGRTVVRGRRSASGLARTGRCDRHQECRDRGRATRLQGNRSGLLDAGRVHRRDVPSVQQVHPGHGRARAPIRWGDEGHISAIFGDAIASMTNQVRTMNVWLPRENRTIWHAL